MKLLTLRDRLEYPCLLASRDLHGQIAHKGVKAPIQASGRWYVERTNAWHNAFNRPQRCYERREQVIDAFFDFAGAIITVPDPESPDPPPRGHPTSTPPMKIT